MVTQLFLAHHHGEVPCHQELTLENAGGSAALLKTHIGDVLQRLLGPDDH